MGMEIDLNLEICRLKEQLPPTMVKILLITKIL